jgi:O-acetyl-ADP-ribose deacetylase (regulator of RNase III)
VTAIVNAANSTLLGGGGVDGAIHDAGGPEILEECQEIRKTIYPEGLPTGEAVITTAETCRAICDSHVGPIYGREPEREAELLAACYQNSLLLARQHGVTSIAFPSISTGAFGYPKTEAAKIASATIRNFSARTARSNRFVWSSFSSRTRACFASTTNFSRLSHFAAPEHDDH